MSGAAPAVLVLGASGFLGRNVLLHGAEAGAELVAVARGAIEGVAAVAYDDWTAEVARRRASGAQVAVIDCIGLADHGACERDPELALAVNARRPIEAARACKSLDVPYVYVGTDALFRPRATAPAYFDRDAPVDPPSAYGRSKAAAEVGLAEVGWGHVVRVSFVGGGLGTGRGLVAFLAAKLRADDEIPSFTDVWFTPAPTPLLARRLVELAPRAPGHAIHAWGTSVALTKHDFLERTARAAGFAPRMKPVTRASLPGGDLVSLDQSLRADAPWSVDELLDHAVRALRVELA